MTPITYQCACCGQRITGLPDIAFAEPATYLDLPEEERDSRAKINSDLCVVDSQYYFVRAVCAIPILGTEQRFGWGVWVSLSADNFTRYANTFEDNDQSELGAMFGWLNNRLPPYPDTLNLQTVVSPQDGDQRPLVWISDVHADHPLFIEQQEGVTLERLGQIHASTICQNKETPKR